MQRLGKIGLEISGSKINKVIMNQKTANNVFVFAEGHKASASHNVEKSQLYEHYLSLDLAKNFLTPTDSRQIRSSLLNEFLKMTREQVFELTGKTF